MLRLPAMRERALLPVVCVALWACPAEPPKNDPPKTDLAETPPPQDQAASKAASMPADHSTSSTAVTLEDLFKMPDPYPDVVAKVDGTPISKAEFENSLRTMQMQLKATGTEDITVTRYRILDGALRTLIEQELMHELAKKLDAKPDPQFEKEWL